MPRRVDTAGTANLSGVAKSYSAGGRRIRALRGVDMAVEPGEVVGVIGPNGAGKTTLLRLIAGITAPDEGRIERRGRTLALIELGAGLHPDLTGAENIGFLGSLAGMSRRQIIERRAEIVEFAGLDDAIHRPVKHFSSGMLARLGFSISVHADPELLLIDEVLSVGDVEFQRRCLQRVASLRQEGCSVVLVTHDLATVTSFCDRAVLMVDGRVQAQGSPAAVVYEYLGIDPDDLRGPTPLTCELGVDSVELGDDLELHLRSTDGRRFRSGTLRIEVLLPVHPAAVTTGTAGPMGIAVAEMHGDWSGLDTGMAVRLGTVGLVPGRYLLRCGVAAPGEPAARSGTSEFRVAGPPPDDLAIPLEGSVSVHPQDRSEAPRTYR